jgi:hypothetical protein
MLNLSTVIVIYNLQGCLPLTKRPLPFTSIDLGVSTNPEKWASPVDHCQSQRYKAQLSSNRRKASCIVISIWASRLGYCCPILLVTIDSRRHGTALRQKFPLRYAPRSLHQETIAPGEFRHNHDLADILTRICHQSPAVPSLPIPGSCS